MTYVIFDIFKRNVWGAILMERPTNNLDFNLCGHRKMLPQLQLYRFSKSKRGRKYSNVVFIVSDSKMIVCQKCFFTPQLKKSFGTDGLHIFEAGFEKLLRVNAEVGPDHLAHAVVRNDFIALLITNSERI